MLTFFFIGALFIIGTACGSFISVAIYRLHSGEKGILLGSSKCTTCGINLKALDLIPIVSYLTLRGKCRYCSKEISYMYPLLELVTGGLFALLFLKYPFFDGSLHFSGTDLGMYLLFAFYTFVLVFTFFYDLHYLRIADEILLPAILIALIATIATPYTPHFFDAILGLAIGAGFFGLQILISSGKWVGMGDLRIGAFMGAILGWKLLLVALFLSYVIGTVVSLFVIAKKRRIKGVKIPFAPLLVTGTFLTVFFGEEIMNWYLSALGF